MSARPLTPEQEAEAQVLYQRLKRAVAHEALALARLMASQEDGELLGGPEFAVREPVHRLGAQVLETVRQARNKKGSRGRGSPVPRVRRRPAAWPIAARRW